MNFHWIFAFFEYGSYCFLDLSTSGLCDFSIDRFLHFSEVCPLAVFIIGGCCSLVFSLARSTHAVRREALLRDYTLEFLDPRMFALHSLVSFRIQFDPRICWRGITCFMFDFSFSGGGVLNTFHQPSGKT